VKRLLWVLATCLVIVLGLRTFVGDFYYVTSSSMLPAIGPDELIAVRYDQSPPERLEMVVARVDGEYVVKRAAGIGGKAGENLMIDEAGDLVIDGAHLPPDLVRPRVLVFDSRHQQISRHFSRGSSAGDPWTEQADGVIELDASAILPGYEAGLMRYHQRLHDHHLNADWTLVEGQYDVHDWVLEFQVSVVEPGGVLRAALVEQGDTFWLVADLTQQGTTTAMLVRDADSELSELGRVEVPLPQGDWTPVSFSNIDNHLRVLWGDPPVVLEASYDTNTSHPRDGMQEGRSWGARIKLGGEGCRFRLRDVRVLRDLHYTGRGDYGIRKRYFVQPGEVFLLGDNSADSLDSREIGAIPDGQIVGRPAAVIWPPAAMRWL